MITRLWHGWTTIENAPIYEKLLRGEVLPGIADRRIPGYRGVRMLKRTRPDHDEVEFITLMEFDNLDGVKDFMGDNYELAYLPDHVRDVLKRFDVRVKHYETVVDP